MKKLLLKRITAVLTAVCILLVCIVPLSVSASSNISYTRASYPLSVHYSSFLESYNIAVEKGLDSNAYILFGTYTSLNCFFYVPITDESFICEEYGNYRYIKFISPCYAAFQTSSLPSYDSSNLFSLSDDSYIICIRIDNSLSVDDDDYIRFHYMKILDFNKIFSGDFTNSSIYSWHGNNSDGVSKDSCLTYILPSSNLDTPDIDNMNTSHTLYGAPVYGPEGRPDSVSFTQWIIDNGHIQYIIDAGFNVGENKIKQLTDWWLQYNSNLGTVVLGLPSLVSITNIADINISLANSLISCYNDLYAQYRYWLSYGGAVSVTPSDSSHPHWRQDEETGEDGDYTLMTDSEDDDTLISILREILRTTAAIPSYTYQIFDGWTYYFRSYLSDFSVLFDFLISLPSVISSSVTSSINDPVEMIIEAINNSSGSSSGDIDVTITESKQTEINNFFIDWNTQYTNKINEKIPVVGQLSELFDDEFFEKIGIDMNNDGEVYSYYRSDPVLYDVVSDSDSGSDSSLTPEQQAIMDMCSHFDNADPSFLDDVHYSEYVPEWFVTIDGEKRSIFNFKLFAKYRTQVHSIIIFCIYTLYFLSLFKSIPSIIGNVSDVHNAFDKHSNIDKGDDVK